MRNLITDVPGVLVGNAHEARLASGVTVARFEVPVAASCAVLGGAPGDRETRLLEPETIAPGVDAIVLSGGSTFGLDASTGAQSWLREHGRGVLFAGLRIPLAPQAICFDLLAGGDKDWGLHPPYRELGYQAAGAAADTFALGTAGAGYGATTFGFKGGLGSASATTPSGFTVGALVVANSIGAVVMGNGPHFWAGAYERDAEFGGLGWPSAVTPDMLTLGWKGGPGTATTIALVATDADIDKAMLKRLAIVAHGGIAKAMRLSHAISDGDTVFSVSTRARPVAPGPHQLTEIGAVTADCLARAIARAVYEATALPFPGALPAWKDRFGSPAP